jgi:hypothetical protein
MVCTADLPFKWVVGTELEELTKTGVYEKGVASSLGCDSLYYVLNLDVLESLVLNFDIPTICADDDMVEVDYTVSSGKLTGYSVVYSDKAKDAGFENVEVLDSVASSIQLPLPKGIRPDRYEVDFTFYNSDCGDLDTTLTLEVLYPSDIIAQRWNDVLAIKNSEYNGGYEFVAYQWFLNGTPLEGFTTSQYYTGLDLDFGGEYQVLLTRQDDGVAIMTCGLVPEQFAAEELENVGVLVFTNERIEVDSPQKARGYIYSLSGLIYMKFDLNEGMNSISVPSQSGLYIMVIEREDGEVDVEKIVVK